MAKDGNLVELLGLIQVEKPGVMVRAPWKDRVPKSFALMSTTPGQMSLFGS
jgi:hypothetical protein